MTFSQPKLQKQFFGHVVFWLGILFETCLPNQSVLGQGRLSQVRSVVKADSPPTESKENDDHPPAEPKKDRKKTDSQSSQEHHHGRRRDDRCQRPCVSTSWFSGSTHCEPCYQPASVITVYPAPVVSVVPTNSTSVVAPQSFTPIPLQSTDLNHGEAIVETSKQRSPSDWSIGEDWFQTSTIKANMIAGGGNDDLTLASIGLLAMVPEGIGLDLNVKTWREDSAFVRDHFWLGDANLVYEFANYRRVRSRIGIGVNWLADAHIADAGLNLTTGLSVKLNENWLLDLEGDIGTLGESDFLHGQISLARRFNVTEVIVGYDHYDIGGVKLSGVFGGLQFRF